MFTLYAEKSTKISKKEKHLLYEKLVRVMAGIDASEAGGIEIGERKYGLKTVPSCFTVRDAIGWLMDQYAIEVRDEALLLVNRLVLEGFLYSVTSDSYKVLEDTNDSLLRFQAPFFWPSVQSSGSDFEHAVFLTKINIKKGASALKAYEMSAFTKLRLKLAKQWEEVMDFATSQMVEEAEAFDATQQNIVDSQERAFWLRVQTGSDAKSEVTAYITNYIDEKLSVPNDAVLKCPTWPESILNILGSSDARNYLREFLEKEHAAENLVFWETASQFAKEFAYHPIDGRFIASAENIWNTFMVHDAPLEINIPHKIKDKVKERVDEAQFSADMYQEALISVQQLMRRDTLPRFLKSKAYAELLRAHEVYALLAM